MCRHATASFHSRGHFADNQAVLCALWHRYIIIRWTDIIVLTGDGISAVATRDEKSRKKKNNHYIDQIDRCRLDICLTNVIGWTRRQLGSVILTHILVRHILDRKDWRLAVSRATHWRGRAFKVRRWELVRHISTNTLVKLTNIAWIFVWQMWLVANLTNLDWSI